eukprot:scpid57386/ scgid24356/ Sphingosine kinase 1
MAESSDVLLSQGFFSGKHDHIHLELRRSGLHLRKEGKKGVEVRLTYSFEDIIGASVVNDDGLDIWVCPFVNKGVVRKAGRRLEIVKLKMDGATSPEFRAKTLNAFRLALVRGARHLDIGVNEEPSVRRFMIYINPYSGTKQAEKIMRTQVQPMLQAAGVQMEVVLSAHRGFVQEHAKSADFSGIDSILIVSGDGLVTEALNGIMSRTDFASVLQIPFAVIPAGSGNALAASVLHASKETYGIVEAVYVALKGSPVPLDIMSVTSAKRRIYSILSVTWGLLADVDIGSDKFRKLGNARFTLAFMQTLASLKKYPAKLSFLPAEAVGDVATDGANTETESVDGIALGLAAVPKIPSSSSSRRSLRRRATASNHSVESPSGGTASNGASNLQSYSLPKTVHLPAFSDGPPDPWVVEDGQFISVCAVMPSHLAWDTHLQNHASLADGLIHLTFIGRNASRSSLLTVFTELGAGAGEIATLATHQAHDLQHRPVKAFRLEMDPALSYLAVDGEHVEGGSIQCEVMPQFVQITARLPAETPGSGSSTSASNEALASDSAANAAVAEDSVVGATASDAPATTTHCASDDGAGDDFPSTVEEDSTADNKAEHKAHGNVSSQVDL